MPPSSRRRNKRRITAGFQLVDSTGSPLAANLSPRQGPPPRELPCHVLAHQAQPQGGPEPRRAGLLASPPRLGLGLSGGFGLQHLPLGRCQPLEVGVDLLRSRGLAGDVAGDHLPAIGTDRPPLMRGKVGAHRSDPASSRPGELTINENTPPGANRERGELVLPLVPHR
jgi:hypothetical protein